MRRVGWKLDIPGLCQGEGESRSRAVFLVLFEGIDSPGLGTLVPFRSNTQDATMETTPHPSSATPGLAPVVSPITQGDHRWAQRPPVWRERELSLHWPQELLEAFSLRMASHGMSISRALMLSDKRYALKQLVHAQTLCDESLRLISMQLFRHFEARQAGIPALH